MTQKNPKTPKVLTTKDLKSKILQPKENFNTNNQEEKFLDNDFFLDTSKNEKNSNTNIKTNLSENSKKNETYWKGRSEIN